MFGNHTTKLQVSCTRGLGRHLFRRCAIVSSICHAEHSANAVGRARDNTTHRIPNAMRIRQHQIKTKLENILQTAARAVTGLVDTIMKRRHADSAAPTSGR